MMCRQAQILTARVANSSLCALNLLDLSVLPQSHYQDSEDSCQSASDAKVCLHHQCASTSHAAGGH